MTAVFHAGVRLHVLDHLVDVFCLFAGEDIGESYSDGDGWVKEEGEEEEERRGGTERLTRMWERGTCTYW